MRSRYQRGKEMNERNKNLENIVGALDGLGYEILDMPLTVSPTKPTQEILNAIEKAFKAYEELSRKREEELNILHSIISGLGNLLSTEGLYE